MIRVNCSSCGRRLKLPDEAAGRKFKCPQCGNVTRAAAATGAPDAPAAPAATGKDPAAGKPEDSAIYDAIAQAAAYEERVAAPERTDTEQDYSPIMRSASRREPSVDAYTVDADKLDAPPPEFDLPSGPPVKRMPLGLKVAMGAAVALVFLMALIYGLSNSKPKPPPLTGGGRVENVSISNGTGSGTNAGRLGGGLSVDPPPAPDLPPPEVPALPADLGRIARALAQTPRIQVEIIDLDAGVIPPLRLVDSALVPFPVRVDNLTAKDSRASQRYFPDIPQAMLVEFKTALFSRLGEKGFQPYDPSVEAATGAAGPPALCALRIRLRMQPVYTRFSLTQKPGLFRAEGAEAGAGEPSGIYAVSDQFFRDAASGRQVGDRWVIDPRGNTAICETFPSSWSIALVNVQLAAADPATFESVTFNLAGAAPVEGAETEAPAAYVARGHQAREITTIEVTGSFSKTDEVVTLNGRVVFNDVDFMAPVADMAAHITGLVGFPASDWRTVWKPAEARANATAVADAARHIFVVSGSACVADPLAAEPRLLHETMQAGLQDLFQLPVCRSEWLRPFIKSPAPLRDTAIRQLAFRRDRDAAAELCAWLAQSAENVSDTLDIVACALIDMGYNAPALDAVVRAGVVSEFRTVAAPENALGLNRATAASVLQWLMVQGDPAQRATASAVAWTGGLRDLIPQARDQFVEDGADADAFVAACRSLARQTHGAPSLEMYTMMARRLMASDLGSRRLDLPAEEHLPRSREAAPKFPDTVAAVICRKLVAADKVKSGPILVELLASTDGVTRVCATEALLCADYVDAALMLRDRRGVLVGRKARRQSMDTAEMRELDVLRAGLLGRQSITRYEDKISAAQGLIAQGQLERARDTLQPIFDEKPGADVARRAAELLAKAKATGG